MLIPRLYTVWYGSFGPLPTVREAACTRLFCIQHLHTMLLWALGSWRVRQPLVKVWVKSRIDARPVTSMQHSIWVFRHSKCTYTLSLTDAVHTPGMAPPPSRGSPRAAGLRLPRPRCSGVCHQMPPTNDVSDDLTPPLRPSTLASKPLDNEFPLSAKQRGCVRNHEIC